MAQSGRNPDRETPGHAPGGFIEPRAQHEAAPPEETSRLYGLNPVLEALRAGRRQLADITIAEGAHDARLRELLERARQAKVPVRRVPRSALPSEVGKVHQGIVASVAAAKYADAEVLLDELGTRIGSPDAPLVVVLDGVEDPRNFGAILRTVECAGANGVFIPERRAVGLTEVVAKSSAGAVEHVPVARVTNIVRLLDQLKELNIWTVGTGADARTDYTEWDWKQPSALILGNEGSGLHRLVRERCDTLVSIPVTGRIDSLNVSVAAGVILYEALRQRRMDHRNAIV